MAVFGDRAVRKDGRRIWISLSVSPVQDTSGKIIGAASIKRDVTDEEAGRASGSATPSASGRRPAGRRRRS